MKRPRAATSRKESVVGCGIVLGIVLILATIPTFIFFPPGAMAILGTGVILTGISVFYGLKASKTAGLSSRRHAEDVIIVARYAIDNNGLPQFDHIDGDEFDKRLYVRVQFRNGQTAELRCPRPIFDLAGEGKCGLATIEGDWMGSFIASPLLPDQFLQPIRTRRDR